MALQLSIEITGYGVVKDPRVHEFTVFILQIQQKHNHWLIYRRVDSFLALSSHLQLYATQYLHPSSSTSYPSPAHIPICPTKRQADPRIPETMEMIRNELSTWLNDLLTIASVATSRTFQEFITTEMNLAPPGLIPKEFPSYAEHLDEMNMDDMFATSIDDDHVAGQMEFDDLEDEDYPSNNQTHFESFDHYPIAPPEPSAASSSTKQRLCLDDFDLLKVIGKGSFGKVFQVRKRDNGLIYAMKVLRKENIIKRNQVEHTRTERQVLGYIRHPFVVGLNYAFQTSDKLYFVLDYCAGGELFFHLGKVQRFPEARACFYIAQITLALEYMHSLDIIYRDLKPENVLLDDKGHIKLTDFGLSKEGIQDNFSGAHSFCGTPEYLAPEILNRSGHGQAVDWWSLGALLYEMLTGLPPFYCRDRDRLFDKIRRGELSYPKYLSENAKSLLRGLLERDPTKRLGSTSTNQRNDATEIKSHPFFKDIDWDRLYNGQLSPPWTPSFSGRLDTSQFDHEFTSMPLVSPEASSTSFLQPRESETLFQGFTYTEESNMLKHSALAKKRPPASSGHYSVRRIIN